MFTKRFYDGHEYCSQWARGLKASLRLFLASAIICCAFTESGQAAPAVTCRIGPIERTYGGIKWLVYGCDDKTSLVVVSEAGSPAMPFTFFFSQTNDGYQLHGGGTGDKRLTDAAYKDLAALTASDIAALIAETVVQEKKLEDIPNAP